MGCVLQNVTTSGSTESHERTSGRRTRHAILSIALVLMCAACGGGGGGNESAQTTPRAWMLGSSGMLRSDDAGATWAVIAGASNLADLESITFLDRVEGWGGGAAEILRTHDGGDTWSPQGDSGADALLEDVVFLNSELGVVVGATELHSAFINPLVLRTTDHGVHWTSAAVPDSKGTGLLRSVCFTRDGTALAVGVGQEASPVAVLTTDMASTWVNVTERMVPGTGPWSHAACAGDADLWVVGTGFQVLHSADRGATWTDAADPIRAVVGDSGGPPDIGTIEFTDPRLGWASGVGGDGHAFVLRTIDGGRTWMSQSNSFQPYEVAVGDFFFTPDGRHGITIGAGGTQPLAFATRDAGNTWTPSAIPADPDNRSLTTVGSIKDFAIVP